MSNRLVALILLLLLVGIHTQLWQGRGSLAHVRDMRQQIDQQLAANTRARQANERLAAEVHDLREGLEMVEEKARSELGMVRQGEIYVHVTPGRR
ncbi:septum formation initiator family protein [Melaminivora sp.]|uniref:septum formation initiator family protein n=1 Tax=Melaminivora sp. TaxID=1933032 RepID=UPI0028A58C7C|nr:septum formation initiator family protein [Melaminivora sp.]